MSGGHRAWLAGNGGRVRTLARSEEGSEQRRGRASEGEGEARVSTFGGRRGTAARKAHAAAVLGSGGARSVHGGHVSISSDRWRATVGARWEPILGWLWADLDHGPKSKVEAHLII